MPCVTLEAMSVESYRRMLFQQMDLIRHVSEDSPYQNFEYIRVHAWAIVQICDELISIRDSPSAVVSCEI